MTLKCKNILLKILEILMIIMPISLIRQTLDTDIWFMLCHGKYILSNGFPTHEILTVHSDYSFQIQKWATCVLFYWLYKLAGFAGIIFFVYISSFIIEGLMYLVLKQVSNNSFVSLMFTSITMLFMNFCFMRSRPQIFSYIFLLLEIYVLEKYVATNNKKYLIFLPIISVIYIQFHSTQWIMLFIVALCYLCDMSWIRIRRLAPGSYSKKPIVLSLMLSVASGLINPYGYKTFAYIFNSMADTRHLEEIRECQQTPFGALVILLPTFAMIIYKLWQNKSIQLRYMFLFLGTLIMGLAASRNEAYALIGFAVAGAYLWKDYIIEEKLESSAFEQVIIPCITGSIIVILFGINSLFFDNTSLFTDTDMATIDAVDTMALNVTPSKDIKVFTTFNTGGYTEWTGYTTYMDARSEVYSQKVNKKEQLYDEIDALQKETTITSFQNKYHFDYYIADKGSHLSHMLYDAGYVKQYENDKYIIYESLQ